MSFKNRSREIHLSYTYKKRFNEIVKNNNSGSNYLRARTSATQEVTIGNVLDYLDRVIIEKNEFKEQVAQLKKEKIRNGKKKNNSNRTNHRSANNLAYSDRVDSDYSVTDMTRKTYDGTTSKSKVHEKLKEQTDMIFKSEC